MSSRPRVPTAAFTPSRRTFLTSAAASVAATALPASAAPKPGARKRPLNVLFVMSDDMRVELGCYGSRFHPHTPHIDALASSGVRFDRNYCQFPLCNPSRASLLSGRRPAATHVLGNRDSLTALHPDWTTLPHLFRNAGYTTVRTGKLFHARLDDYKAWTEPCCEIEDLHPTAAEHKLDIPHARIPKPDGVLPLLPQDDARALHSDQLLSLEGNGEGSADSIVADKTIEHLHRFHSTPDTPFFLGCGFSKPHSPPEAPQRLYDLYDAGKLQLPPDFAAWPTVPPGFPQAAIRMRNADLFINRGASPEEAQQVIRAYLASISFVDYNLGRVLATLDELGMRDNTLVVFVADHGYQLGEKGKWSKAGSLFEPACRVPLIIRMPGAAGNGRPCLRITQSLDLYRTIAELAGLTPPAETEGHSLVPLLHDPRAAWDYPAFSIWSEDGKTVHGTAVRTERWRYAEYGAGGENGAMLLDPHADPLELTNVADNSAHATDRAHLSQLLASYSAAPQAKTYPSV